MSIEKILEGIKDALDENNKLLKQSIEARADVLKAVGTLDGKKDKKSSKSEAAETSKKDSKSDKKSKAVEPDEVRPVPGVTLEEVAEIYTEIHDAEDKSLRKDGRVFIKQVLEKLGVAKIAKIDEDDLVRAHYWAQLFQQDPEAEIDFDEEIEVDEADDDDEDDKKSNKSKKDSKSKKSDKKSKKSKDDDDDDDDEDEDEDESDDDEEDED